MLRNRVIFPQKLEAYSTSGQCKTKTNIIQKSPPPSFISLPAWNVNAAPVPDISTHFCQPPRWTGALRSGSLVTGPAGDGRASSASTFLYPCTCGTGLPRPAQVPGGGHHVSIHLNRACRPVVFIHPHSIWNSSPPFLTPTLHVCYSSFQLN